MVKFKIDKVHGMVIAYYGNGKYEFVDSLRDVAFALCNKNNIYIEYNDLINKTMEEVVVYVGRAKLNPLDTWDEEKGKEIAIKDLHERFNKAKIRLLKRLKKRMEIRYNHFMNRLETKLNK